MEQQNQVSSFFFWVFFFSIIFHIFIWNYLGISLSFILLENNLARMTESQQKYFIVSFFILFWVRLSIWHDLIKQTIMCRYLSLIHSFIHSFLCSFAFHLLSLSFSLCVALACPFFPMWRWWSSVLVLHTRPWTHLWGGERKRTRLFSLYLSQLLTCHMQNVMFNKIVKI